MTTVTVDEVKRFLRVVHSFDDQLLGELIASAESEVCRFLNRTSLPTLPPDLPGEYDSNGIWVPGTEQEASSEDPLAPDVRLAISYLVQAGYEGAKPEDRAKMREAAETILMPYRTGLGV